MENIQFTLCNVSPIGKLCQAVLFPNHDCKTILLKSRNKWNLVPLRCMGIIIINVNISSN